MKLIEFECKLISNSFPLGNEKATEILIENGANIHAKNVRGHTPRDIAIKNGKIVKLLMASDCQLQINLIVFLPTLDFRKIVDLLDNTRPKSTISKHIYNEYSFSKINLSVNCHFYKNNQYFNQNSI